MYWNLKFLYMTNFFIHLHILRWYGWQIWSPDDHHASLWSTSRHHLPNRPQIWFLQCWQPPSGFQSFNWRFVNISFILQQDNYQFLVVLIIFSCPQTSQYVTLSLYTWKTQQRRSPIGQAFKWFQGMMNCAEQSALVFVCLYIIQGVMTYAEQSVLGWGQG